MIVPVKVSPLEKVCVGDVTGILRDWSDGEGDGVTDTVLLLVNALNVAVTIPVVNVATGKALQGTSTAKLPAETGIDAGKLRAGLELLKKIVPETGVTALR